MTKIEVPDEPAAVDGVEAEFGRDTDPWQLLLAVSDDEIPARLIIARDDEPASAGLQLKQAAPFARALNGLVGPELRSVARAMGPSVVRFRFEADPELLRGIARGIYEVMPTAARSGFRSMVRESKGAKHIVGHGQFVPEAAGVAAAGGGAIAAGSLAPVLIVAAISIGAEAAAQQHVDRQLKAIRTALADQAESELRKRVAALDSAAARLNLASRALIDSGQIPTSLGIDGAVTSVSEEWHRGQRLLKEWQDSLGKLPDAVTPENLDAAFTGILREGTGAFWQEVEFYRLALALQTRSTLLLAAQAAANDPENAFPLFRAGLEQHGELLDAGEQQLRDFLATLAARRITVGSIVTKKTANHMIELTHRIGELAHEVHYPSQLRQGPMAIEDGHLVVEGSITTDGTVRIEGAADGLVAKPVTTKRS